ncbi:acetyltransferase [Planctomycetales bacterium]|nr:acetyltransferase [Planctomycetales bacterium]GHT05975.1 acetyltransferase [Planctomycetales bacterium]GHV23455.1 acetyltransferase [Planctomycetales bacterium]
MRIRKPKITDINAIHQLIKPFAEARRMLALPLGNLTERLRDFLLLEVDGELIGAVAVHIVWEDLVEIRSLAVRPERQKQGYGSALIDAALTEAREIGATKVFTLTFVPEFFQKHGFAVIDRHELPHKVWQDCTHCPLFPDCGETALTRSV